MTEEILSENQKIKTDVLNKTVESLVCTHYGFFGSKKKLFFPSLSGTIQERCWCEHLLDECNNSRHPIDKGSDTTKGCLFSTLELQITTHSGLIYDMELSAIQTAEYIEYIEKLANDNLRIENVIMNLEPCLNSKLNMNFTSIKCNHVSNFDAERCSKKYASFENQPLIPDSFIRSNFTCCGCGSHSGLFYIKKRYQGDVEYKCSTCKGSVFINWIPNDETSDNIPQCKQCGNENGFAYVVCSADNMLKHFCSNCHSDLNHNRLVLLHRTYSFDTQLLGKNLFGWEDRHYDEYDD